MDQIAAIRAFSRFYTRQIGALDAGHLDTRFTLIEARVIYEIGTRSRTSAAEIARATGVDPSQLSRLIARMKEQGFLQLEPSARDRRQFEITLTVDGAAAFETLNSATNDRVATFLSPLEPARRAALVAAMSTIRSLMGDAMQAAPLLLRPHRIGELGWLVHRQGLLYSQQFGWNIEFEALIAGIYRDFEFAPPAPPKALWIAERNGAIMGSVFVTPSDGRPGTAQRHYAGRPGGEIRPRKRLSTHAAVDPVGPDLSPQDLRRSRFRTCRVEPPSQLRGRSCGRALGARTLGA